MNDAEYRRALSALRAQIRIIENNLRERDYSFDYAKQPSKALYKYRQAFIRNDKARYESFIQSAAEDPSVMHTGTLSPYDVIAPVLRRKELSEAERRAMDATWNALENYAGDAKATNFENAKREFEKRGYRLPQVIFWNVNSRNMQQPVRMNDQGVALVSGCSPQAFSMLKDGNLEPYELPSPTPRRKGFLLCRMAA